MKKYQLWFTLLSAALTIFLAQGFMNALVWVYLIPLFVVILNTNTKKAIFCMVLYGSLVTLFSFWWVKYYSTHILILAWLFFTTFHIALSLLIKRSIKNMGFLEVFVPPAIWILLYHILSIMPLDNFWINLGMFHSQAAPIIWYIGSLGITFLIILFNSSIAFFIAKKKKAYLAITMIITIIMVSCFVYSDKKLPEGKRVKIALIQGNFPQTWGYRVENAKTELYTTYKELTYEAIKQKPGLVIWPEYSIPIDIFKDEMFSKEFTNFTRTLNKDIIIGTLEELDNKTHYDTALIFLEDSEEVLIYKSVMPVPYEKNTKGYYKLETIKTPLGKMGILMCYEETQPEIARAHVNNGAELLIALSNNNRFKESNGLFLTSLYSTVTASENGKYVTRVTNTGITQIVNPQGKIVGKINSNSRGILVAEVYLNDHKTFYTKYGNVLVNITVALIIIIVIKRSYIARKKHNLLL
ncbi:MAG: apolipoprotein N-acyltransferase [Candidatus Nanoarchaeia archaeon]